MRVCECLRMPLCVGVCVSACVCSCVCVCKFHSYYCLLNLLFEKGD